MTSPISILHLLDGRYHCGASMVTRMLIQSQQKAGDDVQLACLYKGAVAAAARDEGMAPIVLPASGTAWRRLLALQRHMTASDCALSTSRSECSPVFLIEAMALARPVLAADVEDVAALVHDNEHGFIFPVGSIDGLVENLILLARNPALGERIDRAARERIQALFNAERTISQIRSFYGEFHHVKPVIIQ